MSCWLLGIEGYQEIAGEFAIRSMTPEDPFYYEVQKYLGVSSSTDADSVDERTRVAMQELYDLNCEAYSYRYSHNAEALKEWQEVKMAVVTKPIWKRQFSDVQLFKHLRCILYQLSEGEVPNAARYKSLVELSNAMALSIITKSPEWASAEWGF